ncbi:hypothetical protein M0R19_03190 [Candidatus Pacearchaeota archaeon]|jgi:hypothetical protein|nr:hypothetical protein [Candidatus Pacearchaeota archaeon]
MKKYLFLILFALFTSGCTGTYYWTYSPPIIYPEYHQTYYHKHYVVHHKVVNYSNHSWNKNKWYKKPHSYPQKPHWNHKKKF